MNIGSSQRKLYVIGNGFDLHGNHALALAEELGFCNTTLVEF